MSTLPSTSPAAPAPSKAALRTSLTIQIILILFYLFDALMKFVQPGPVKAATAQLGFPLGAIPVIGALLLACTILYAIPALSVLGAITLTGYLGGAVASQIRIGAPVFSCLFPVIFCALTWLCLLLRYRQLRGWIPLCEGRRSTLPT